MDERPETEEHAEGEPSSPEADESTERGEGPRDQPADAEQLHGIPSGREQGEER